MDLYTSLEGVDHIILYQPNGIDYVNKSIKYGAFYIVMPCFRICVRLALCLADEGKTAVGYTLVVLSHNAVVSKQAVQAVTVDGGGEGAAADERHDLGLALCGTGGCHYGIVVPDAVYEICAGVGCFD